MIQKEEAIAAGRSSPARLGKSVDAPYMIRHRGRENLRRSIRWASSIAGAWHYGRGCVYVHAFVIAVMAFGSLA